MGDHLIMTGILSKPLPSDQTKQLQMNINTKYIFESYEI